MKTFVIVGGGVSGALTVINLVQESKQPVTIYIIEKSSEDIGAGLAYSTTNELHLLNVPVGKMSCFPDQPNHLFEYLQKKGMECSATDFISRKLYGEYIKSVFQSAVSAGKHTITILKKEVVNITETSDKISVYLDSGEIINGDKVVLAIGNFEPSNPRVHDDKYTRSPNYIKNAFKKGEIENISAKKNVLIIGTGLTAIDILLTLNNNHHEGKIIVISNHGYLPIHHQPGQSYPDFYDELQQANSSFELFKLMRNHITKATKSGIDYRAVIDVIRPHTQQLWLSMSTEEKKSFLTHLRHLWGVARHRMPLSSYQTLQKMFNSKNTQLKAGRLLKIESDKDDTFTVTYKKRKKKEEEQFKTDYIINCTGPESNYDKINIPLIQNMLKSGLITKDAISYGIQATEFGNIINNKEIASKQLYTIGPPMKGILWECTAVPEIRVQAKKLAQHLLSD